MSLIRLIIRTAPPTTQSIPSLRLFTLRPLLRKSLQPRQPCSPRRPFASAAPNPAPRTATSNPTGAGGSARTGNPRTYLLTRYSPCIPVSPRYGAGRAFPRPPFDKQLT
ncbi:hypothetical protein CH063_08153 [Colletotrichum higginsianum]|uniref:Uncharacterized protein n=1 Tax=Colletotrichum higginsianum (strain IMI 349063) TaxID=759273 RepID=H1V8S1_COLHI|nr:hypothetical protein CH063_08153 [Colletotrichum higginsianum]